MKIPVVSVPFVFRRTALIVFLMLFTCPAFAKRRDDVIVMKNGDRFTGEIKSLQHGELIFKSEYMLESVHLDWNRVERLESKDTFIVGLSSGIRVTGSIGRVATASDSSKGFQIVNVQPHTLGHLPDVGMNLISRGVQVSVNLGDRFKIDSGIPLPIREIREALSIGISGITYNPSFQAPAVVITVPRLFKDSLTQCKLLHDVLSNTELFPVCKAENFSHADWSKWDNLKPTIVAPKIMQGKVIAKVEGKRKVLAPPPKPTQVSYTQQQAFLQAVYGQELAGRKQARPKPRIGVDFDEGGM